MAVAAGEASGGGSRKGRQESPGEAVRSGEGGGGGGGPAREGWREGPGRVGEGSGRVGEGRGGFGEGRGLGAGRCGRSRPGGVGGFTPAAGPAGRASVVAEPFDDANTGSGERWTMKYGLLA